MEMVDAPITNCIEFGKDFILNHMHHTFELPIILIAATDGCFGYLKTPLHFEHLLLRELLSSLTMEDWSKNVAHAIGQYAQDDYSMSITCNGWHDFTRMRDAFSHRYQYLNSMIQHLHADADTALQSPEQQFLTQDAWASYSAHYSALLKESPNGN